MTDPSLSAQTITRAISPTPTDEEAAAIVAAVDAMWPGPAEAAAAPATNTAWRFSGRWWHQDRL